METCPVDSVDLTESDKSFFEVWIGAILKIFSVTYIYMVQC